jgi:cytochrome o ubiquinol oxidase subunit II
MRYAVLGLVLISAATLGGCSEGVLYPEGPIAVAERQILFNSFAIRLAIMIPGLASRLFLKRPGPFSLRTAPR